MIPLYKKGDKALLGNCRPISILPSISKIFERIIFNQINDHFTSHDLYYNGPYGFREKHSTQLAALELIDRITHELDMGNTPINIYIDLSKAFDTLDHTILISKLQHYGITGAALQLDLDFNKIATQGAPQMAVDKEANSLSRVYSYYSKFNLCLFYM